MRRFILLSHQRSGSTLLVRAIQQHPRVRMHSEILTNTEDESYRRRELSVAGRWFGDGDDGAGFLRHVFTPQGMEAAVGFKLMYYHAVSGPAASAWDFLRADRELYVISLKRDDLLRCLISDEVAQRTRQWQVRTGQPLPDEPEPFSLTPERCRAHFEQVTGWIERARTWFGARPTLELEYERDLELGFADAMERVFSFLGVPAVPVEKRLEKMARRSAREQLANFDELAAAFAGSPYERFFR